MLSYWGVDHGDDVVSKADYGQHGAPSGGRRVAAGAFGGYHAAVAGRKGKKLRAVGNQAVGGIGGSLAGAGAGAGLAALATRGRSAPALVGGTYGGSIAGGLAGGQAAVNRNQRKGYYKREQR